MALCVCGGVPAALVFYVALGKNAFALLCFMFCVSRRQGSQWPPPHMSCDNTAALLVVLVSGCVACRRTRRFVSCSCKIMLKLGNTRPAGLRCNVLLQRHMHQATCDTCRIVMVLAACLRPRPIYRCSTHFHIRTCRHPARHGWPASAPLRRPAATLRYALDMRCVSGPAPPMLGVCGDRNIGQTTFSTDLANTERGVAAQQSMCWRSPSGPACTHMTR